MNNESMSIRLNTYNNNSEEHNLNIEVNKKQQYKTDNIIP